MKKKLPLLKHAMSLAERGRGFVSPNPVVGALLLRNGKIIAQDWHRKFGEGHAEWNLLTKFRGKVRPTDVLVVTLEPCCHTGKKTPPCTDSIVKQGVKNVLVGMVDPNPEVKGKGIKMLRNAGMNVEVICPVLSSRICTDARFLRSRRRPERVRRRRTSRIGRNDRIGFEMAQVVQQLFFQNRFYFTWITKQRPWVTLKIAQTLDGRITPKLGQKFWLTGKKARAHAHATRAHYDAILVGANTVIVDNPRLTARKADGSLLPHHPRAVILDHDLCISITSHVVRPGTLIIVGKDAKLKPSRIHAFQKKGVELISVNPSAPLRAGTDRQNFLNLHQVLKALAERNIASLLVEGGPRVWSSFLREGLVDELNLYLSPKVMGEGVTAFYDLEFLSKKFKFQDMKVLGHDIFLGGVFS